MKKKIFTLVLLGLIFLTSVFYLKKKPETPRNQFPKAKNDVKELIEQDKIKNGDFIFQSLISPDGKPVHFTTNSKHSHCGIIFQKKQRFYVYEAAETVQRTPLARWIARGEGGKYVIKRLKNAEQVLTQSTLTKMKQAAEAFEGKKYDFNFEWSDDKLYSSELVWKLYQRATGIEIGRLEKFGDLNFTNDSIKARLKERFGKNIPINEAAISIGSIFASELLTTVISNE